MKRSCPEILLLCGALFVVLAEALTPDACPDYTVPMGLRRDRLREFPRYAGIDMTDVKCKNSSVYCITAHREVPASSAWTLNIGQQVDNSTRDMIHPFAVVALYGAISVASKEFSPSDACVDYLPSFAYPREKLTAFPRYEDIDLQYISCKNTSVYCISAQRTVPWPNISMPDIVRHANSTLERLYLWWCPKDAHLIDDLFGHTHPRCKDFLANTTKLSKSNARFQCLYVDRWVDVPPPPPPAIPDDYDALYHDKDVVEDESDSFSLFDYVHAYVMLPFLGFHVSLVVCLFVAGRNDPAFREGFFILFMLLSVVDAVVVVHDNLFAYAPPLYHISDPNNPTKSTLAADLSIFVASYCYIFQPLAHVVIAIDRFSSLRAPSEYQWTWRDRSLKATIGASFTIPFLLVATVFPIRYGRVIAGRTQAHQLVFTLLHIYRASCLVFGALIGFTVIMFAVAHRRRSRSRATNTHPPGYERKLLAYAALMLLVQLWVGFWCGVEFLISDERNLGAYFSTYFQPFWYKATLTFAARTYCMGGSIFLIIVDGDVRRTYLAFFRLQRGVVLPIAARPTPDRRHTLPSVSAR